MNLRINESIDKKCTICPYPNRTCIFQSAYIGSEYIACNDERSSELKRCYKDG